MQDTKLFETILGITTPWHVTRVELKTDDQRVDVWLEHEATQWPCPECGGQVMASSRQRSFQSKRSTSRRLGSARAVRRTGLRQNQEVLR